MMKFILLCMLLATAAPAIAESTNGVATGLNATLSATTLEAWDFKGLLGYASMRCGIPVDLSTNLYVGKGGAKSGLRCTFRGVEVRYVIAWIAKFLGGTATVENGTILVRPVSEQPNSDPALECTEETQGE